MLMCEVRDYAPAILELQYETLNKLWKEFCMKGWEWKDVDLGAFSMELLLWICRFLWLLLNVEYASIYRDRLG